MRFQTGIFVFLSIFLLPGHISCDELPYEDQVAITGIPKNNTSTFQIKLGVPCHNSQEPCAVYGSYCINGLCFCDPTFFLNDIPGNQCLGKAYYVGDPCQEDAQCNAKLSSNSKCRNNTCICLDGSTPNRDETECIMGDKFPGENCTSSKDCFGYPDKSECLNGFCQCRSGYVPALSNNETSMAGCLPFVNRSLEKCEQTDQCQEGTLGKLSECNSPGGAFGFSMYALKACICTKEAVAAPLLTGETDKCYQKAEKIWDSCEVEQQCVANLGIHANCSADNNQCVCSNNSFPSHDNRSCLPNQVLIGDSCRLSSQCPGEPNITSECSTNEICLCKENFVPNSNFNDCLPIKEKMGEPCEESWQCNTGNKSECAEYSWKRGTGEKVCKCEEGYVQEPGTNACFPKVSGINGVCENHAQCISSLKRSLCIDGICQCVGKAVPMPTMPIESNILQDAVNYHCVSVESNLNTDSMGGYVIQHLSVAL